MRCVCSVMSNSVQPHGLTVALQAPLPMGFSRQEYWSGLSCPPLGDLPDLGIKPTSFASPALAGGFFFFFFYHLCHLVSLHMAGENNLSNSKRSMLIISWTLIFSYWALGYLRESWEGKKSSIAGVAKTRIWKCLMSIYSLLYHFTPEIKSEFNI